MSSLLRHPLLLGGLAVAVSVLASIALVVLVPSNFLTRLGPTDREAPKTSLAGRVLKNVAGWVLIAVGIVLSLPGVPGPGLLVTLIGLFLVDLPGKEKVERKILGSPKVTGPANRLRRLFGKAPLELPH